MKCMPLHEPAHHPPPLEVRVGGHRDLHESFPAAYACPGCPRIISGPIWQLSFSRKNHDFLKILENPLKFMDLGPSRVADSCSLQGAAGGARGAARGAREAAGSVRGGAVGVPESRNISGLLPVLSLLARGTPGDPCGPTHSRIFFCSRFRLGGSTYLISVSCSLRIF